MKTLYTLFVTLIVLWAIPAAAKDHCHIHRCDSRCDAKHDRHHSNHACALEHCDGSCARVVTNTVIVPVHVTNTILTVSTVTVTVTNTVRETNDCPALPSVDYKLQAGHSYRLEVSGQTGPWVLWGFIRCPTNTEARVFVPLARSKSLLWQLVDATPGYPRAAVQRYESDCVDKPTWTAMGRGRVLSTLTR